MAASLKFFPGSTIRWHTRRYVVIDYVGLEAIIARESGKRQLERVPVNEAEFTVTATVPVELRVNDCVVGVLTATLPKERLGVLTVSVGMAAFNCRAKD